MIHEVVSLREAARRTGYDPQRLQLILARAGVRTPVVGPRGALGVPWEAARAALAAHLGAPPDPAAGVVSLREAARRAGFDPKTLRAILARAGVQVVQRGGLRRLAVPWPAARAAVVAALDARRRR